MKSQHDTVFTKFFRGIASLVAVSGLTLCLQAQETNLNFQAVQAAADQGDAEAQYELAVCYGKGTGVKRDFVKAAGYLRRSAEQGYAEAQTALGYCYGSGRGVTKSQEMAAQWYRKAADQGSAMAQYAMGTSTPPVVASPMT